MTVIDKRIWPLVIVGKGSAAAFYASTIDFRHEDAPKAVLAIGDGDAWSAAVRGHHGDRDDPTRFINHPMYLITHFQATLPEFSAAKVDRLEWAKQNSRVLEHSGVQLYTGLVKLVSEVSQFPHDLLAEDGQKMTGYKIELQDSTEVAYAYKVVMASGAGGHRAPDEGNISKAQKAYPKKFLDLDAFAKLTARDLQSKTVFVYGPNAAIDAVQKALHYKCKIRWLMKTDQRDPPVLATQPQVSKALEEGDIVTRYKQFEVQLERSAGNLIGVKVDGKYMSGDYFVYGMGQTGGPAKAIQTDIQSKLVPIYDKNRYLSDKPGTILGYEALGTGLKNGFEVVGAMAPQVGRTASKDGKHIKQAVGEARTIQKLHDAIQVVAGTQKQKLFLLRDVDDLAKESRIQLETQLRSEVKAVTARSPQTAGALETLVSLILHYHGVMNYRGLMGQQTDHMPKGAVADAGQLTAIGEAMAAKHAHVPKYVGTQTYTGKEEVKGMRGAGLKDEKLWADAPTTGGDVNYSKDNPTVIQIHLCLKYPYIPDKEMNDWVGGLMKKRHASGVGFPDNSVFDAELKRMNEKGLAALRVL